MKLQKMEDIKNNPISQILFAWLFRHLLAGDGAKNRSSSSFSPTRKIYWKTTMSSSNSSQEEEFIFWLLLWKSQVSGVGGGWIIEIQMEDYLTSIISLLTSRNESVPLPALKFVVASAWWARNKTLVLYISLDEVTGGRNRRFNSTFNLMCCSTELLKLNYFRVLLIFLG